MDCSSRFDLSSLYLIVDVFPKMVINCIELVVSSHQSVFVHSYLANFLVNLPLFFFLIYVVYC